MNKIEITELNGGKFDVWLNGENVNLSSIEVIAQCARVLSSCLRYILSKVI